MVPNALQATGDTGGTYTKVADGEYIYTFGGKLPAGYDQTVTNTVGIYGSRNLTEFDLGTQYDDTVFNFVPNGARVTVTRDVIKTADLQQVPRSARLPRRFAAQHGTLRHVPHPPDHRLRQRQYRGHESIHPQAARWRAICPA